MQNFSVDKSRCIQCGQCIYTCNRQILVADPDGCPSLPEANFDICNACGHCSAICPTDALISPKCDGERAEAFPDAPGMDFAAAKKFLLSCRSMRRYKQEPVARETILEILDVARRAPTASNIQGTSWAVLDGRKKAEEFTALTMEWFDKVLRYDAEFTARYDVDAMVKRYRGGYDTILRGAPNAVFAITDKSATLWGPIDGSIAITYFCLAAHGRGIGSCWCGFGLRAIEAYQPLRDLMGLDDTVTVQGMAFFGYPELEYHALPPRKPLRVTWA